MKSSMSFFLLINQEFPQSRHKNVKICSLRLLFIKFDVSLPFSDGFSAPHQFFSTILLLNLLFHYTMKDFFSH